MARAHAARGGGFPSGSRPYTLVLFRSVALVVCLMRKNVTPEFAGAIFGIRVLAEFAPRPGGVVGAGAVLVDGTICPTWEQMDNAGAFLGHLRPCSDQDHVSAVRAAYINGMIGSIAHTLGGGKQIFTTTSLAQARTLLERCRGREKPEGWP